jgi:hypothetical protein
VLHDAISYDRAIAARARPFNNNLQVQPTPQQFLQQPGAADATTVPRQQPGSDPYEQLEVARKITAVIINSPAYFSTV